MEIRCKKDLFNGGKCFTKGKTYQSPHVNCLAGLMDTTVVNDLGEKHNIGSWWRNFVLVNK